MGSSLSTDASSSYTFRLAMDRLRQRGTEPTGGYFGGDEAVDPTKSLREYEASLSAKAKEDVVRSLARALKNTGIDVDPEGDLDKIVRVLAEKLPNPSKSTFKKDAKAQEEVCKIVAKALNDEFTPGVTDPARMFIDTTFDPVEICRKVGEWAHTFASGVNTEFLNVHVSVKNALQNIVGLSQIMDTLWAPIEAAAHEKADTDQVTELFTRAMTEQKRQIELLKNILHVRLAPAIKELEILLQEEQGYSALIKGLGLRPGTKEFGTALAAAVTSLGVAASVAQRVNKALKEVGVALNEYLGSPDYASFRRVLDQKIEGRKVDPKDLAKFLEAAEVLRRNFGLAHEPQVRETLERGRVGGAARVGGVSKLDTRVELLKKRKQLVVRDFVNHMARNYDELLAAVKAMSPELGKKIPLTDKTDALRDTLVRVRDVGDERIELSLIGYTTVAEARERKERYLSAMKLIVNACNEILEMDIYKPAAAYFSRLKAAVEALMKTVDYYTTSMAQTLGAAEGCADGATEGCADGAAEPDDAEVFDGVEGGASRGAAENDLLPQLARSALSLREAVSEFQYFYYVARVRENLAQTSKELEAYGKDYEKLLGTAVAARLQTLEAERKQALDRLTEANLKAAGTPESAAFAGKPEEMAKARKWVEREYDMKSKFYRALQVLDLYMKAFTQAIAKDPDAMRDIARILSGYKRIVRWFSDQTGDSLWKAFEQGSAVSIDGRVLPQTEQAKAILNDTGHYYTRVGRAVIGADDASLGVPAVGMPLSQAETARKLVSEVFDNFQALKNLINAFVHIGEKFGGHDLRKEAGLSPPELFKTLNDYLKESALCINISRTAEPPKTEDAPMPAIRLADLPVNIIGAVKPYEAYFGGVGRSSYTIEDRYFVTIMKAMAAKILTALGVYDMFERRTPLIQLTPTRMIIGGYSADEPEAIEGACELYFRMPRLIEFYRKIFRWDPKTDAVESKIAMVPELEGIFAGLIRIIFQKMASPQTGDYSDTETYTVIRELNQIYEHFREKHGDRASHEALRGLVAEINRRYGEVKREDMEKYWKMVKETRKFERGEYNDTDYAILPEEGEELSEQSVPSDRYFVPKAFEETTADKKDLSLVTARETLRTFCNNVEKALDLKGGMVSAQSYALLIKQSEAEMRRATTKEAKLAVAVKLIQGTRVAGLDASKSFMFHETVVSGLNVLSAIYLLLSRFSSTIDVLDPVKVGDAIMDALHGAPEVREWPAFPIDRARLLGPGIMNSDKYARYIRDGRATAEAPAGENLLMRGGLPADVGVNDVYRAWALEVVGGVKLPALPSTYKEIAPSALGEEQLRTLRALRFFARFVTRYDLAMRDLLENLYALSSSGLVEVRFPQGAAASIRLNFSKLRGLAESLLSDVKRYLDVFRPHLPKEVIDRYEEKTNPGSVFWLEENLIDKIFRGLNGEDERGTLAEISRQVDQAFKNLTRDTHVAVGTNITRANLIGDGPARARVIVAPSEENRLSRVETYGHVLSEILFYDATQRRSGQPDPQLAPIGDNYALADLIRKGPDFAAPPPYLPQPVIVAGAPGVPGAPVNRYQIYTKEGGMTRYRSLLFAFNQLLARYLSAFTDPAGARRIYYPLINAFANGIASRSVSEPSGNSFPDMAVLDDFGRRGDPKPTATILESLAYVLQRLTQDVNPVSRQSDHLVTALIDVPLYIKESMRCNLPGFVKLFGLVEQKGEFVKQFMQKTEIDCRRPNLQAIAALMGAPVEDGAKIQTDAGSRGDGAPQYTPNALTALDALDTGLTSDATKAKLVPLIDAIVANAYALSSAAVDVLKELGDQPVYFKTQEGSIETYKAHYGQLPLMPISLSTYFLNDLDRPTGAAADRTAYDDLKLFPKVSLGEPAFKVQYGARGVIMGSTPPGYDQMPGVKASLESYNATSPKQDRLEPDQYLGFVRNLVTSLRYITEARNYKSALSTSNAVFSFPSLLDGAIRTADNRNAAYPIGKTEQDVVNVVESSNREEEADKIVNAIGAAAVSRVDREKEIVYNIIDMNLIPINVHALMRSIPLANLYNYEYTFEQMVASIYGEPHAGFDSTRRMFLHLLVSPYSKITVRQYGSDVYALGTAGYVHQIFRGDNNLGMGRPKFLSDQIFNKALFGSVYQAQADYDEAGPNVGAGISRGRSSGKGPMAHAFQDMQLAMQLIGKVDENLRIGLISTNGPIPDNLNAWPAVPLVPLEPFDLAQYDTDVRNMLIRIKNLGNTIRKIEGVLRSIVARGDGFPRLIVAADQLKVILAESGRIIPMEVTQQNRRELVDYINRVLNMFRSTGGLRSAINDWRNGPQNFNRKTVAELSESAMSPEESGYPDPLEEQSGRRAFTITYLQGTTDDPTRIVQVDVGEAAKKKQLEAIGRARFDTTLVRNLFFITNLQRIVRLKLNRELTHTRNVVDSSHSAVAPGMTEYGVDPFEANEILDSEIPPGVPRFNDRDEFPM